MPPVQKKPIPKSNASSILKKGVSTLKKKGR